MLREQDAAEQEALIQQIAAKIPGGTESVADFRREQRLKEANAAPLAGFTLEEHQSEFVRLRKLPRYADRSDDAVWAIAAQNLSRPRTRGLEQLGGIAATEEFEPGKTFRPRDAEMPLGDLFGGFFNSDSDLPVQIGPTEDEVDPTPFGGLPEHPRVRQQFFTLEEHQSEFVRLRKLPRYADRSDDAVWAIAAQNLSRPRTRGLEQLGGIAATEEFEPGKTFRPRDAEMPLGDLFGGFFNSDSGLSVQIGPTEDEVDPTPFGGLPEHPRVRQQFFTLEEHQSEFVRLRKLPRYADRSDDAVWAIAAQNLSRPRTRGLEQLGGIAATEEFEPGKTFRPRDAEMPLGDLFGGFFNSDSGLSVQIGPTEDEFNPNPFPGLPRQPRERQPFFTLEEQQSEFVRLKRLKRYENTNDNVIWAIAAQNLASPRTRGLEALGAQTALDEFDPGATFKPVDRDISLGDIFGGLSPETRRDLEVQIGAVEDEVAAGGPPVLSIDEATLFRRLRPLHPGLDNETLMMRVRALARAARSRGLEALPVDAVIAEFDPTTNRRFIEDNGFGAALKEGVSEPAIWVASCLAAKLSEEAAVEYAFTGRVTPPTLNGIAWALAECVAEQAATDLGSQR